MQNTAGNGEAAPPAPVDLTNCDKEPIHIPGSIQPHGVLLAATESDLRIVSVSANLADFGGVRPKDVLGTQVADTLDEASQARLRIVLAQSEGPSGTPLSVRFAGARRSTVDGLLHRHQGLVYLELEAQASESANAPAFFRRTSDAIKRLQAARTLEDACAGAAREVRQITGFDRVKVYRFAADFSGEVIAENRIEAIDSFLGLHFPPSDIPAQARELYTRNPIRIIPDIRYTPFPSFPTTTR